MGVKATAWAWDQPVGGNDKLVLLRLADHANDEGCCWPSQETLHVKCGVSERTVRQCLVTLEQAGLISREMRRKDGRRTSDLITLLLPAKSAASQPADSAASQPANHVDYNRQNLPGNLKQEPSMVETPPQPPRGGRARDRDSYRDDLAQWLARSVPDVPVTPQLLQAYSQARKSGKQVTARSFRRFLELYWPQLLTSETRPTAAR